MDHDDPTLVRRAAAPGGSAAPVPTPLRITSHQLLGARREIVIAHEGRDYCLRITQNGKLILTA